MVFKFVYWGGACMDGYNNGFDSFEYVDKPELNYNKLISLGFTMEEISTYDIARTQLKNVTVSKLTQFGIPYDNAKRMKYIDDIMNGKVNVESEDELIKHLKRMQLVNFKIGIDRLEVSGIKCMERKCVVAGMPAGTPFCIYDSKRNGELFKVLDVTGTRILIISDKIPKLKYGDSKKLIRVSDLRQRKIKYYREYNEIPQEYRDNKIGYKVETVAQLDRTDGKQISIWFNRDYARLCGRFIVVGSMRRPEMHLGMIEIICIEGTRVYVFARQANQWKDAKYSGNFERVYDYGFNKDSINQKLLKAAGKVYRNVNGVFYKNVPANTVFESVEKRSISVFSGYDGDTGIYESTLKTDKDENNDC